MAVEAVATRTAASSAANGGIMSISDSTTASPAATDVGVYFRDEDYAGVLKRLGIDALDVVVALALSLASSALCAAVLPPHGTAMLWGYLLSWFGVWWIYFTVLKRSKLGTVGYHLCGVRIVNLKGERPGLIWLTLRLLFAFLGPFNVIIDLFWIGNDDRKQALRDKFAGTYVVHQKAQPAGRGEIRYSYYTLLGTNFIFAEVAKHPRGESTPV
jgi:uncharacterized RDD family membrane protein YckC